MKIITFISLGCLAATLPLTADGVEQITEPVTSAGPSAEEMAQEPEGALEGEDPARGSDSFVESDLLTAEPLLTEREPEEVEAPNEIIFERFVLRGAAVQWFKTDNVLQLFNPFAPERYGSGEQNLAYDAITGRPKGLTIFAIDFGVRRDRR